MSNSSRVDLVFQLAEEISKAKGMKIDIKLCNSEEKKKQLKNEFDQAIKRVEKHMPLGKFTVPNRHKTAAAFTNAILASRVFEVDEEAFSDYYAKNPENTVEVATLYPNEYLAVVFISVTLTADSRSSKHAWSLPPDYHVSFPSTAHRFNPKGVDDYAYDQDFFKLIYFYANKERSKRFPLLMFSKLLQCIEIASDCAFYDMKSTYY